MNDASTRTAPPRARLLLALAATAVALGVIAGGWVLGAALRPDAADASAARAEASAEAYETARADAFEEAYATSWQDALATGAAAGERDGTAAGTAAARAAS